jgi:hypothetical protein
MRGTPAFPPTERRHMDEKKKRFTIRVCETVHSWRVIDVEARNEEAAKQLAENEYEADWAEHATSEIETTVVAVDGKPFTIPDEEERPQNVPASKD